MPNDHMFYRLCITIDRAAVLFLLWLTRRCGLTPRSVDQHVTYRWVSSPDGGFDHWFDVDGWPTAIFQLRREVGFWPFVTLVLGQCRFLVGGNRRAYREQVVGDSEHYYCLEPMFELRHRQQEAPVLPDTLGRKYM
jgi:hypothetical protein